jgi:hypothetical protein
MIAVSLSGLANTLDPATILEPLRGQAQRDQAA